MINVVTVCRPDGWVDTHLLRWRWQIYRTTPGAQCLLIVPYGAKGFTKQMATALKHKVAEHFADIRLVREHVTEGHMWFLDSLRAGMTAAFGVKEALWLDCDADALVDLNSIPAFNGDMDILWTPNAVVRPDVRAALEAFRLNPTPPYVEPAVMYLRCSLLDAYLEVANSGKISPYSYLPGVNTWNVVVRRHGRSAKLPDGYNVMVQRWAATADLRIVHFCGSAGKEMREKLDFTELPQKVTIYRGENKVHIPVRWNMGASQWDDIRLAAQNTSANSQQSPLQTYRGLRIGDTGS